MKRTAKQLKPRNIEGMAHRENLEESHFSKQCALFFDRAKKLMRKKTKKKEEIPMGAHLKTRKNH